MRFHCMVLADFFLEWGEDMWNTQSICIFVYTNIIKCSTKTALDLVEMIDACKVLRTS